MSANAAWESAAFILVNASITLLFVDASSPSIFSNAFPIFSAASLLASIVFAPLAARTHRLPLPSTTAALEYGGQR
jgi:hypothetical protein